MEASGGLEVRLWLYGYLVLINLLGLFLMGYDKHQAKKGGFRISEATLFAVAILGGSIGSILGMYLFRHKTRHWYFVVGMPFILLLQAAAAMLVMQMPIVIKVI